MDALHPRLLVTRFTACFRFHAAVLPELIGAELAHGDEEGPYAHWDVHGEGAVSLFDRAAMATALGTTALPPSAPAQDTVMLVTRVEDVDAAHALCLSYGARDVVGPTARPDWGPTLRTAHVRDPDGNLLELQSY